MARVHASKKNNAGKEIKCSKCAAPIKPGERYRWWQFRNCPKTYRCMKPTCAPRASDLTRGRIGQVYQLNERVEDACAVLRESHGFDDFKSEIEDIISDAENLKGEFEESKSNMPDNLQEGATGELLDQRVEALEEFGTSLQSELDSADFPEDSELECSECNGAEGDEQHLELEDNTDGLKHEFKSEVEADERADEIASALEAITCECD